MGACEFLDADEGGSGGCGVFDSDRVSEGLVLMSLWRGFNFGALTGFGVVCICMEFVVT